MSDWWIDETPPPPRVEGIGVLQSAPIQELEDGFLIRRYDCVNRWRTSEGECTTFLGIPRDDERLIEKIKPDDKIYMSTGNGLTHRYVGRVAEIAAIYTPVCDQPPSPEELTFNIRTELTRREMESEWNQRLSQQQP